jgi:hypothetical protein
VPQIAYLGPAYAGKRTALETLARDYDGTLALSPPIVELRVDRIVAQTVTGLVFEDAARLELVRGADAIVFVADTRASRAEQTQEAWKTVADYLEKTERPGNTPVVIQWGHVDAPDAQPIETVEAALGIEPFVVAGELRMPNPYALRYPARFTEAGEAFDAAARAAVDGPFTISRDTIEFAKAMLDQQLATQLAALVPNVRDPKQLAKGVVRGDAAARERYDEAMSADTMALLMERFATDPAFQELIADQVAAHLESSVLAPDMHCSACKTPCVTFEISGVQGGPFGVGDKLPVDLERLSPDADWLVHAPDTAELVWLTAGECEKCQLLIWCALTIQDGVLASVWPVAFTRATYERAHVASAGGLQLEAAKLLGVDPDSVSREMILEALERL